MNPDSSTNFTAPISKAYAVSPSGHLRIERSGQPGGDLVLMLSGELDIESAQTLAGVIADLDSVGNARLVLDLSGVAFIDSTGISALVQARRSAEDANTEFVLTQLPKNVDRLFSISGLTSQFTIT